MTFPGLLEHTTSFPATGNVPPQVPERKKTEWPLLTRKVHQLTRTAENMILGVRSGFELTPQGPLPIIDLIDREGQKLESIPFFLVSQRQ